MSNNVEGSKPFGVDFRAPKTSALETPETRVEYKLNVYLKEILSTLEQSSVPEDQEVGNVIATRLQSIKEDLTTKLAEWSAFTLKHEEREATIKDVATGYEPSTPELKDQIARRKIAKPDQISNSIDIGLSLKTSLPDHVLYYSIRGSIDEHHIPKIPKTNNYGRTHMPPGRFGIFAGEISPEAKKRILELLEAPENPEYKPNEFSNQPIKESFEFRVKDIPGVTLCWHKGDLKSPEHQTVNFELLKLTINTELLARLLLDKK